LSAESDQGEAEPGEHGDAQEATEAVHPMQHLVPGPQGRAAEARTTRTARTQLWGPWPTSVQMRQLDSILHRPNGYLIVWAVVLHELGTCGGSTTSPPPAN